MFFCESSAVLLCPTHAPNWKQLSRMETRLFTATQSHGILSYVNHVNLGAHHSFMMTLYI